MKAGRSNHNIGTRIRIKNLTGDDSDLNGVTGELTHPFASFEANYVGVYLDDEMVSASGICNLASENEFEVIE